MHPLLSLSASQLAQAIQQGTFSPSTVVDAHIARIEAVNPALNAVVQQRFARARQEAREADERVRQGASLGPLHGVPITIKEAFDVAGTPATCGLLSAKVHLPQQDAVAVARLKAAGAIVLGKTNTPDNCWDQETISYLFGRTNNPWDLARSPGGSTGGEAAILAAGGSPLGLGSDIAGSIRLPAAWCGIVGLRPTSGLINEVGFWPPSVGRLADLNAVGPMARRVEDVALAFAILSEQPAQPLDSASLAGQTFGFWLDDGLIPSSGAVQGGVNAAVRALTDSGMRAHQAAPDHRRLAVAGWLARINEDEREAICRGFGGGELWSPLRELQNNLTDQPRIATGALRYWLSSHYGSLLMNRLGVDGQIWRHQLRAEFTELVGEDGFAICPVFPTTAPRHGWSVIFPLTISYQTWVNLAGLPALVVPVGRSGNGMPVGVQLVGAPGTEWTLLKAGYAIQQALMPVAMNCLHLGESGFAA
ncbi:amidase [Candidatus Oscillochloris fontis]|uniref:amidase n=1 Tax=Candidatus Oscillochloris fontis TaxID=2496868 RepID=UPI001375610B|nr:amidase [Candidatus Oscillochloris fontis]